MIVYVVLSLDLKVFVFSLSQEEQEGLLLFDWFTLFDNDPLSALEHLK